MSDNKMNLNEWLEKFNAVGDLNDVNTAIDLGAWDWFCQDKSLMAKIRRMKPMVEFVSKLPWINPANTRVVFKNCLTGSGKLYDSYAFVKNDNDNMVLWYTPKSGHSGQAEAEIFSIKAETAGTVAEVKNWLKAACLPKAA